MRDWAYLDGVQSSDTGGRTPDGGNRFLAGVCCTLGTRQLTEGVRRSVARPREAR